MYPTSENDGSVTIDPGTVENVGVAVGISMICHSVPEIQCTSALQSAILNSGSLPTSGNVDNVIIDPGMVEIIGVAVGISVVCHSVPEIQCTSGLLSAILNLVTLPTSGNVGSVTVNSSMVENVG